MTTTQGSRTEDEGHFLFQVWPLNATGSWEAVQLKQFLCDLPKSCQSMFGSSTAMAAVVPGPKETQNCPDPGTSAFQKDWVPGQADSLWLSDCSRHTRDKLDRDCFCLWRFALRAPLNEGLFQGIGCIISALTFWSRHFSKGNLACLNAAAASFSSGNEKLLLC